MCRIADSIHQWPDAALAPPDQEPRQTSPQPASPRHATPGHARPSPAESVPPAPPRRPPVGRRSPTARSWEGGVRPATRAVPPSDSQNKLCVPSRLFPAASPRRFRREGTMPPNFERELEARTRFQFAGRRQPAAHPRGVWGVRALRVQPEARAPNRLRACASRSSALEVRAVAGGHESTSAVASTNPCGPPRPGSRTRRIKPRCSAISK